MKSAKVISMKVVHKAKTDRAQVICDDMFRKHGRPNLTELLLKSTTEKYQGCVIRRVSGGWKWGQSETFETIEQAKADIDRALNEFGQNWK